MVEVKTFISGDVIIRKISGQLTFDEIINIFIAYYAEQPTKHVVWDLTGASMQNLKFEDLDNLADFVMKFAKLRKGGKTAIVASGVLEYGLARTIDLLAESKNRIIAFHAFRTFSEAAKWIGMEESRIIND